MAHPEDAALLQELTACETRVWQALVTGDIEADAKALHRDFLGIYPSGFASKKDHTEQLRDGPTVEEYTLSECRMITLGPDHAVLSYRADFLRKNQSTAETMFVSSIWQRDGSGWINILSQDTPAIE